MRKFFKKNQKFGEWILLEYLGGGGNGEVWKAINLKDEIQAIKILKKIKPKAYSRFIDEIKILEKNSNLTGLIPITAKFLPESLKNNIPFYVMPIAESLTEKLKYSSLKQKIQTFIKIGETLNLLHRQEVSHRDLKPANILILNNEPVIADFGLVHYPNKKNISLKNEPIGPKWTMAPEMRRESSISNGLKADIYSIAKTLWIIITGQEKGFDGQYKSESILSLNKYCINEYTLPIEKLIEDCTDNEPEKRPNSNDFVYSLKEWIKLEKNYHLKILHQWNSIQQKLFLLAPPKSCSWDNLKDIKKILNIICTYENLNHAFFPNGGGLDLIKVRISHEKDCLELDFKGLIDIIKPKALFFESFEESPEWNYFRIDLQELDPIVLNEYEKETNHQDKTNDHEELSELLPGRYFPFYILEHKSNHKDSYPITTFSRQVTRWFRGSFVFFSKRSPYNLASSTYDGRHNKMEANVFRAYIQKCVNLYTISEEINKNFYDEDEEKEIIRRKSIEDLKNRVYKEKVYVCYKCGKFVSENGSELQDVDRNYSNKVVDEYGHKVIFSVYGNCCRDKY